MSISEIISLISSDSGLSNEQKQMLTKDKARLEEAVCGASGAALGVALGKYRKMSRTTQAILAALGFGAGTLIFKYLNRPRFANYNAETGSYQIDSKRI
jgi:hypothetical protein